MQKIAVIGSGYVGLVTAACFADVGNTVYCVDINQEKIEKLTQGIIPIYEPGLSDVVKRNISEERLFFTTDLKDAVSKSLMIFIAVGTPCTDDGRCDLSQVYRVASDIGDLMDSYRIIVDKSTVPVGTGDSVEKIISERLEKRHKSVEFDVVSNPEFLKEGDALADFTRPDRIIVGCENPRVAELMKILYHPFNMSQERILIMDRKSAEMTKYAANCMLAAKISFINEMANLCELTGADIEMVRRGIGADHRIGHYFIYPGCGYGGSCFPKDVRALISTAEDLNFVPEILKSVENVNNRQKSVLSEKIIKRFGNVKGMKIALWGLTFKPNTDDMREAPSLVLIKELASAGACFRAYDPVVSKLGISHLAAELGEFKSSVELINSQYEALEGCDFLVLVTEWKQFRNPDFDKIRKNLKLPLIFDGRNQYFPEMMKDLEIEYHAIGRKA